MSGSRRLGTNPRANGRSLRQLGLSPRQLRGDMPRAKKPKVKHIPRDSGIPRRMRFAVLKRDGFACTYCGAHGEGVQLHVDHVLPEARGGETKMGNLRTACRDCNLGKGSDHLGEP